MTAPAPQLVRCTALMRSVGVTPDRAGRSQAKFVKQHGLKPAAMAGRSFLIHPDEAAALRLRLKPKEPPEQVPHIEGWNFVPTATAHSFVEAIQKISDRIENMSNRVEAALSALQEAEHSATAHHRALYESVSKLHSRLAAINRKLDIVEVGHGTGVEA